MCALCQALSMALETGLNVEPENKQVDQSMNTITEISERAGKNTQEIKRTGQGGGGGFPNELTSWILKDTSQPSEKQKEAEAGDACAKVLRSAGAQVGPRPAKRLCGGCWGWRR